jgi:hypothetical protein
MQITVNAGHHIERGETLSSEIEVVVEAIDRAAPATRMTRRGRRAK